MIAITIVILTISQGQPQPLFIAGIILALTWTMSVAMQITGWYSGLRSEKPHWVAASFTMKVQDPGRPYRDSSASFLIMGVLMIGCLGFIQAVISAIGLGLYFASGVILLVLAAGGSDPESNRTTTVQSGTLATFCGIMFAGIAILASAIFVFASTSLSEPLGKPPLTNLLTIPQSSGSDQVQLGSGQAVGGLPVWVLFLGFAAVILILLRTSHLWMVPIMRLIKTLRKLWEKFLSLRQSRATNRFHRIETHKAELIAKTLIDPFQADPTSTEELIDGFEELLVCAGVKTTFQSGLRATYLSALQSGLPDANIKPLFISIEKGAYLEAIRPSPMDKENFSAIRSFVIQKTPEEVRRSRSREHRINKARGRISTNANQEP